MKNTSALFWSILVAFVILLLMAFNVFFCAPEMSSKFGAFFGGVIGVILTAINFFLIFITLKRQQINVFETHLLSMINNLNNYRAFVPRKIIDSNEHGTDLNSVLFKHYYELALKGNDSLFGLVERDVEKKLIDKRNELLKISLDFLPHIDHYFLQLNSITDYIEKHDKEYISWLINNLSIYEIYYIQHMTIRMHQYHYENDKYYRENILSFFIEHKLIPRNLHYSYTAQPYWVKYLEKVKIEIP
jgi:hypothetical protein